MLYGIEFPDEKYVPQMKFENLTEKIDYIEKNA